MSLAVLIAYAKANEALIATILFLLSELLGAIPTIKSNGIVSFGIIQVQKYLKSKGGVDTTP